MNSIRRLHERYIQSKKLRATIHGFQPLYTRAGSRCTPNQRDTLLQSNAISHWLGANLESTLYMNVLPKVTVTLASHTTKLKVMHERNMIVYSYYVGWYPLQLLLPLYVLNCYIFQRKYKHVFTFYIIPPHWHDMAQVVENCPHVR